MKRGHWIHGILLVVFLVPGIIHGITYDVTYTYTATPTLGIFESSEAVTFYYSVIDKALASPTQVGTVVVTITKFPTYDRSPIRIDLILNGTYFGIYGNELWKSLWIDSVVWEGKLVDQRYASKEGKYSMDVAGYIELVGSVGGFHSDVEDYYGKTYKTCLLDELRFKKIFDLTHRFRITYKISLKLFHRTAFGESKYESQVIPETIITVDYVPKK